MDVKQLKESFSYNFSTGVFTRLNRKNSHGSLDGYGYLILKIKRKQYKAHRMAWLYHYGEMPALNIDHINGDRLDNRIENLRSVSQLINNRNQTVKINTDTGYKGVYIDKTKGLKKKFAIKVLGKTHRFYSALKASKFREEKLKGENYGERHFE
jgi:hypothetical protein